MFSTDAKALDIKVPFDTYLLENSELQPSSSVVVSKSDLLSYYKDMVMVRRIELTADALYKAKFIRGFCHLSIGQVNSDTYR